MHDHRCIANKTKGRFDDNWGLEDPTGKSDEEFKTVIEKIRKDILKLKNGLDKR